MKALLICPADRPAVAMLAEPAPLALLPILGKRLIEYWLEHLRALGAREVFLLAADRPEQIRDFVGDGARWGVRAEVLPEIRELTTAEARIKYRTRDDADWLAAPNDAFMIDCLPALPGQPLFNHYANWFAAVLAWMPQALTPDRIGVHEISPGVWTGLRARVAPDVELRAPCWLGEDVCVESGAVVGPLAVVEDRAFISGGAEVSGSLIGPETYVGEMTGVHDSLAWGSTLIHWSDAACTKVPDPFLLCSLASQRQSHWPVSLPGRLAAALIMAVTSPLALLAMLKAASEDRPALCPRVAVRPASTPVPQPMETLVYYELGCASQWLRRWPQLWNVVRGDFAWVGNRPLNPVEALELKTDFERLWFAAPIGLISLADAEACVDVHGDEARAHASYYAVRAHWRLDLSILARVLTRTPYPKFRLPEARVFPAATRPTSLSGRNP